MSDKHYKFDNGCELELSFINFDSQNQRLAYQISNEKGNFEILRIEQGKFLFFSQRLVDIVYRPVQSNIINSQ